MEEVDDEEYYWRIEDFKNTKLYENERITRWIWLEGVNLGKKIVITGVVISSVTFILPPIIALSTLGLTFSLPAAFVLATYAFTNKLMDSLLPLPSPPSYQKSGSTVYSDGEEEKLNSNAIPIIMEGIREAEEEIACMERDGVKLGENCLGTFVVEAKVGGEDDRNAEQVMGLSAFIPTREEIGNKDEQRNEMIGGHELMGTAHEGGFDDGAQASINEKKIWEQIEAMRTIIGYKTESNASCVEELKAMYEFTGVDLPNGSNQAIDDLAYVDEKLHFLKSIVGVM